ncbi:MAG: hypothetical protein QOJ71_2129 [Actinomycetota bacterium]|nr:hypothetical protein [Actinomycetota bacterium]
MGWTVRPEVPAVLLHYSEDADIREFRPHVPRSNPGVAPAVWAIDPARAPLYWFPRNCPRVAVWANDAGGADRLRALFATEATRVQAIPVEWRDAVDDCRLYEYRFAAGPFSPWPDAEGQWVAHEPVVAESIEPVGPLVQKHAAAGIELRFVDDLPQLRTQALACGLPFSIVRFPDLGTFPGSGRVEGT